VSGLSLSAQREEREDEAKKRREKKKERKKEAKKKKKEMILASVDVQNTSSFFPPLSPSERKFWNPRSLPRSSSTSLYPLQPALCLVLFSLLRTEVKRGSQTREKRLVANSNSLVPIERRR